MIKIIDDYVLDSDGVQYTIGRLAVNRKTRKEYVTDIVCFSSIQTALLGIAIRLRLKTVQNLDGDVKALYEAIRQCDERLINALDVFGEGGVEDAIKRTVQGRKRGEEST